MLAYQLDANSRDVMEAARGDRAAFGRIVHRHRNLVTSVALAVVGDVGLSEDIAQEVFVAAWKGLNKLRNPSSLGPWLRQMTRNHAHDCASAREKQPVAVEDAVLAQVVDPASASRDQIESLAAITQALDELPEASREVLTLYYREGESTAQVAELLGLSEVAVRKRLSRARAQLKDDIAQRFGREVIRTAPATEFTAAVIAALPQVGVSVGATSLGKAIKAASAVKMGAALFGPVVGFLAAVFGPWIDYRRQVSRSRDEQERQELKRYAVVNSIISVLFTAGLLLSTALTKNWVVPFMVALPFALAFFWMNQVWKPRIVARRLRAEREENPASARRQVIRRRIELTIRILAILWFVGFFLCLALGLGK